MKNFFSFDKIAIAISLSLPAGAQAQAQSATEVATIVVVATRTPVSVDAQTRDVTIIDAAEIARSGATSLAALLTGAGGVAQSTGGNAGATSGILLRGANSNQTLVLVDGQRVVSSTSGLTALEAIPLATIERIEIVRGAHSVLYGADAAGGVIHVVTKSAPRLQMTLAGGSNETMRGSASAGFSANALRGGLSVSFDKSAGFNAITNPKNFSFNPDRDGYERIGVNAQVRAEIAPQIVLGVRALHHDLNAQYDGSAGFDDRSKTKQSALHFTADVQNFQFRVGQSQDDARYESEFPGAFRTRTTEAGVQGTFALGQGLEALALLETRNEKIAATDEFTNTSRRTTSVAARLAGQHGDFRWNAAARLDDSNQFDRRTTGSVGASWQFAPQVTAFANVGSAFKAPTFNDLYYPGFSNPALKPERVTSADLGVRARVGDTRASVTLHRASANDLIIFLCDADFNCAPQNVARARWQGVSASANTRWQNGFSLSANFDVQRARDLATNHELPRRAKFYGNLRAAQSLGAAEMFVGLRAASGRFDDPQNKIALAGYALVDLGFDYAIDKTLSLELRAHNITDRTYVTAKDFANPGREMMIGLRWVP